MDDGTGFYNATYNGEEYAPQYIATANLGPYFSGLMLQVLLAGIAFGNFGRYLSTPNYRADSRAHKALAWAVMAQLALVTGLSAELCFYHGVDQDRTIDDIFAITVPDSLGPALQGVVAGLVQGFLLVRASQLLREHRHRRAVFLALGFLAILISFLASVAQTVANFSLSFDFWERMGPFTFNATAAVNLWTNAGLDLSLSATLILGLRRHVLGFNKNTDHAIRRLMRTAATTASYTAAFSTVAAALSVAWPASSLTHASLFLAFSIPGSSLYALSLLATLDARKPLARNSGVVGVSSAMRSGTASQSNGDASTASREGEKRRPLARSLSRQLSARRLRKASWASGGSGGSGGRSECGPMGCVVQVKTETVSVVDQGTEDGSQLGRERRRSTRRVTSEADGTDATLRPPPSGVEAGPRRASVQFLEVPVAT